MPIQLACRLDPKTPEFGKEPSLSLRFHTGLWPGKVKISRTPKKSSGRARIRNTRIAEGAEWMSALQAFKIIEIKKCYVGLVKFINYNQAVVESDLGGFLLWTFGCALYVSGIVVIGNLYRIIISIPFSNLSSASCICGRVWGNNASSRRFVDYPDQMSYGFVVRIVDKQMGCCGFFNRRSVLTRPLSRVFYLSCIVSQYPYPCHSILFGRFHPLDSCVARS